MSITTTHIRVHSARVPNTMNTILTVRLPSRSHCTSYVLTAGATRSQITRVALFFFTATAPTEIYTLSLHDALPISLAIGVIASWVLAWRLKRQTFGLEPYEIAGLLEEREASLQGIHEGAIATDGDGTITLANDEARRLLALPADCVGRRVSQVLPQGRLLKFLSGGLNDEDEVLLAADRVLVASRRAIRVQGREIGHVATLRDSTELTSLARGLGVDSLTDALRA